MKHKVSTHRVVPTVRCDLPEYGYLATDSAASVVAITRTATLLRSATIPPGLAAAVCFEMAQASLVNGHCSISNVALTIREDNSWSLSLRADQNPLGPVGNPPLEAVYATPRRIILPGATLPTRFTAHIKRNQFLVRVRGYGDYHDPVNLAIPRGRPVLFALEIPPFWVERELPLSPPPFVGSNRLVGDYFKTVDRVEVELTYR